MSSMPEPATCTGSCLCESVQYRLTGPFGPMVHCHCSMCRREHGSSFATYVGAPAAGFEWLRGRDHVAAYGSSATTWRYFCDTCGSVTPAPEPPGEGPVFVPAGNLLEDCGARPQAHMFAASRAPWVEIGDGVPRFEAAPPGYDAPVLDRPPPPPAGDGLLTGGCLCGAVRYEITGEPQAMVNCHCSRCRRARSAAHATNLFVQIEQLRWTAGESSVRVFDLPGAERFGVNFCPTCGGHVPRASAKTGRMNVPAGSLDGDPGIGPGWHIFVGSKAPWFAITDGLPRHEEAVPAR